MDPIAVIVNDSIAHVQQAVEVWAAPVMPAVDDALRALGEIVMPTFDAVAGGVVALQELTGPQMFTAIVLVCGAFPLLALGSGVAHR